METSQEVNKAICAEILSQLGGRKFIAMTGAQCSHDGPTLITKFKGSKIANIMYITYNSMDLYDMRIAKYRMTEIKTVAEYNNIGCEDLVPIFESTTGLRTKLF